MKGRRETCLTAVVWALYTAAATADCPPGSICGVDCGLGSPIAVVSEIFTPGYFQFPGTISLTEVVRLSEATAMLLLNATTLMKVRDNPTPLRERRFCDVFSFICPFLKAMKYFCKNVGGGLYQCPMTQSIKLPTQTVVPPGIYDVESYVMYKDKILKCTRMAKAEIRGGKLVV